MGYDGSSQNGVATQHMLPATLTGYGSYQAQVSSYPLPTSWAHSMLPAQYTVMQPTPHMSGVEVCLLLYRFVFFIRIIAF